MILKHLDWEDPVKWEGKTLWKVFLLDKEGKMHPVRRTGEKTYFRGRWYASWEDPRGMQVNGFSAFTGENAAEEFAAFHPASCIRAINLREVGHRGTCPYTGYPVIVGRLMKILNEPE